MLNQARQVLKQNRVLENVCTLLPPLPLIPLFRNAIAMSRGSARAYFAFQDRSQPQENSRWRKPSCSIYITQFQSGIFRNYVLEKTNEDPAACPLPKTRVLRCRVE
jgi:hypothetical protein